jgi:hypothetical protein
MSYCPRCGRTTEVSGLSGWDQALAKIQDLQPTYSEQSMREVKRTARQRKWFPRRSVGFKSKRQMRYRLRRVRFNFGSLMAVAAGALLVASGVFPWVEVNYESFHMNLGASDIYDWLSIYAIGVGLLLIAGTFQRFRNLRSLLGASALTTIGLSAYIWSQVNSLLNLISGFGGLFSEQAASLDATQYLKPELGLWLWAGSVVAGILAYLARDL